VPVSGARETVSVFENWGAEEELFFWCCCCWVGLGGGGRWWAVELEERSRVVGQRQYNILAPAITTLSRLPAPRPPREYSALPLYSYLSQATSTRKQGLKKYMAKHLCASERSYKIDPPRLRVLLAWDKYKYHTHPLLYECG